MVASSKPSDYRNQKPVDANGSDGDHAAIGQQSVPEIPSRSGETRSDHVTERATAGDHAVITGVDMPRVQPDERKERANERYGKDRSSLGDQPHNGTPVDPMLQRRCICEFCRITGNTEVSWNRVEVSYCRPLPSSANCMK